MAIDGINNIDDIEKLNRNWRTAPLSEVQENMPIVEKADSSVAEWAKSAIMMAMSDNLTYEMTSGTTTEAFTRELNEITNDQIAINELPASGQAVTAGAVQNPPETEREQANPELGPEDQVQPNVNTVRPEEVPEEEELPEEEEVQPEEPEFTPEEEQRMRDEAKALDPTLDVGSMSLDDIRKILERRGISLEQ